MVKTPSRYKNASLSNYRTPTPEHEKLLDYVKKDINKNIFITGTNGVGKTYLAWSIYNDGIEKRKYSEKEFLVNDKCEVVTIKEIIEDIRLGWSDPKHTTVDYKNVELLIIDEVGVQYGTDSERVELFDIFDYRWNNELPIIALSNLSKDEIIPVLGRRIVDRLNNSETACFKLKCESMR